MRIFFDRKIGKQVIDLTSEDDDDDEEYECDLKQIEGIIDAVFQPMETGGGAEDLHGQGSEGVLEDQDENGGGGGS